MEPLPEPMLPTAGTLPIGRPGWEFEFKWDGIRVLAAARGGERRLQTRTGRDITAQFPELGPGFDAFGDAVLDGELVVLDEESRIDFGTALGRLRSRRPQALAQSAPATVMLFDVLRVAGEDVRQRPYLERRDLLKGVRLEPGSWVVPPTTGDGERALAASREMGLEGLVAKQHTSTYLPGRSKRWIKARHRELLDVTVIGWRRRDSGGLTLLLAERTGNGLVYAGRCTAPRGLVDDLAPLAAAAPPIPLARDRSVQWVRPVLQVEVWAASREPDGRLRMPRFVRARLDELE